MGVNLWSDAKWTAHLWA